VILNGRCHKRLGGPAMGATKVRLAGCRLCAVDPRPLPSGRGGSRVDTGGRETRRAPDNDPLGF